MKQKKILNVLIIALLLVFFFNIIINYPQIRDYINIRKIEDKSSVDKIIKNNKSILFKIKIPGTHIDYPVIKARDNAFYLNHDYDGNYNQYGSIFIDYREYKNTFNYKNLIVYGHNMGKFNHHMFGDLMQFLDNSFFLKHRKILLNKKKKREEYQVISVFRVKDSFLPYEISFDSDQMYLDWQNKIFEESIFKTEFIPSKENKFITLSTCTYGDGSEKLVVIARLI